MCAEINHLRLQSYYKKTFISKFRDLYLHIVKRIVCGIFDVVDPVFVCMGGFMGSYHVTS